LLGLQVRVTSGRHARACAVFVPVLLLADFLPTIAADV
jgi:hypothetical protein